MWIATIIPHMIFFVMIFFKIVFVNFIFLILSWLRITTVYFLKKHYKLLRLFYIYFLNYLCSNIINYNNLSLYNFFYKFKTMHKHITISQWYKDLTSSYYLQHVSYRLRILFYGCHLRTCRFANIWELGGITRF